MLRGRLFCYCDARLAYAHTVGDTVVDTVEDTYLATDARTDLDYFFLNVPSGYERRGRGRIARAWSV